MKPIINGSFAKVKHNQLEREFCMTLDSHRHRDSNATERPGKKLARLKVREEVELCYFITLVADLENI